MKAKEAIKLSERANYSDMDEIYIAIIKAAKAGNRCAWWHKLTDWETKKLEGDGYKVEEISERNETSYRISW